MIERHWKGLVKKEMLSAYNEHLLEDTFIQLAEIPGFISSTILQRELPVGTSFLIVTRWVKLDDIKKFTGDEINKGVVPEVVQAMMVHYDDEVTHYRASHQFPPSPLKV